MSEFNYLYYPAAQRGQRKRWEETGEAYDWVEKSGNYDLMAGSVLQGEILPITKWHHVTADRIIEGLTIERLHELESCVRTRGLGTTPPFVVVMADLLHMRWLDSICDPECEHHPDHEAGVALARYRSGEELWPERANVIVRWIGTHVVTRVKYEGDVRISVRVYLYWMAGMEHFALFVDGVAPTHDLFSMMTIYVPLPLPGNDYSSFDAGSARDVGPRIQGERVPARQMVVMSHEDRSLLFVPLNIDGVADPQRWDLVARPTTCWPTEWPGCNGYVHKYHFWYSQDREQCMVTCTTIIRARDIFEQLVEGIFGFHAPTIASALMQHSVIRLVERMNIKTSVLGWIDDVVQGGACGARVAMYLRSLLLAEESGTRRRLYYFSAKGADTWRNERLKPEVVGSSKDE